MKIVSSFDAMPMINDQLMINSLYARETFTYCNYIKVSDGDAWFSINVKALSFSKEETRIFIEGMKNLIDELEKALAKR